MTKNELVEKLSSLGYETEEKGSTIIVYTEDDRTSVLKSIEKQIKGSKYLQSSSKSSKGEVKISAFSIIAKKPKGGGAGSGAGAYITSLAESAQCFYCAAAWYGTDFSDKTLRQTAKYTDTPGVTVDQVIKELPEHWVESCVISAKALKGKFGSQRLYFHRGSSFVNSIVANFNSINKNEKFFSNINKWSPADIYMVTEKGLKQSFNFEDFNGINAFLLKSAKSKDIIGVSLKQTKSASIRLINFYRDPHSYQYKDYTLGKRGFFDSKDVYIYYDGGEIQFRGFPTWQGEIKGKTANHGKVSGGPLKTIIDRNSTTVKLDTQLIVESQIKRKDKNFYKKFYEYFKSLGQKMKYEDFVQMVSSQDLNWQSSKYLGTQLIYIMETGRKKQLILSSIINYAKSQSEYSAPHVKVE